MHVKFLDLHKVNQRYEAAFTKQFQSVLDSGYYILGSKLSVFESAFAIYCGTDYCIGTGNGLDALTLILKGYVQLGRLQIGDEILVPANTFIATILSVQQAGLKPVLVEPNMETYTISTLGIKEAITTKTKAIVVTHLYGQLCDMDEISLLAKENNLTLIADAAQAHGATDGNGKKAGCIADAAAFSFYPSKNLGALGDGGAVTTSDVDLHDCIKKLRNYGCSVKYKSELAGVNSRLDELQAAILLEKLADLDADNAVRRTIATRYANEIKNIQIQLPYWNKTANHIFYAYVVRVKNRNHFCTYLDSHKIEYVIHYPIPPHRQKSMQGVFKDEYPITEIISGEVVSIPMSPVLETAEITYVINILNNYVCNS